MSTHKIIASFQIAFGLPVLVFVLFFPSIRAEIVDPSIYVILKTCFLLFAFCFLLCAVLFVLSVIVGFLWTFSPPTSDSPSEAKNKLYKSYLLTGIVLTSSGLGAIVLSTWPAVGAFLMLLGVLLMWSSRRYA